MSRFNLRSPPRRVIPAALGLMALLAYPGLALGQAVQQPGTVTGIVMDAFGEPVAGATVLIEETGQGALTRANGEFIIERIPAGRYTLTVSNLGYRTSSITIEILAGQTSTGQTLTMAIDPLGLEAIVVTANPAPRQKLESSTAITTITPKVIEQSAPSSTAALLKQVPGFYVEASGGNVNGNLFARGMPADGSYRYVTIMEDGIAANDGNDFFFLGADNFVRVDLNLDRIEAVRGGNAALFGSNAPGGVVNFINKTGGPALGSTVKLEAGTEGLFRVDANVNGPFAENWRFNIGGYYNFDNGVRRPGFPSVTGGQLKASVTRLFDAGYVTVSGKYLNSTNVFYLPLPLVPGQVTGTTTVTLLDPQRDTTISVIELRDEFVSGFPSDGTLTSREGLFKVIPLPQGNGEFELPLEKGIAQVGATFAVNFGVTLPNRWEFQNIARVMNLKHQWNAMLPFEIVDADDYLADQISDAGGTAGTLTYTDAGTSFNTGNNLLSIGGQWHIDKPVTNFSDQLTLSRLLESSSGITNNVVLGGYFGHYTAGNLWFMNDILTEVATKPRFVDVSVTDAAGGILLASQNGFTRYLSGYVNGNGSVTLFSFFAGDELSVGKWRFDAGARIENDTYEQNVEGSESFDLGDTTTTADDAELWGDRTFTRVDTSYTEWAATLGVTYAISEATSVYARGSRGYRMPFLDQYLFSTAADSIPAETVYQAEGGLKVSSSKFGISAVAFWLQIQDFPSQDVQIDAAGNPVFVTAFVGKARTLGLEFEGVWVPAQGARIFGQATLMDPEYTNFISGSADLSGKRIRRIPKVITLLGGAYERKGFGILADWRYTGNRFSNNENSIVVPGYSLVDGRVWYNIPNQGIQFYVAAQNLLDGSGLTEGNPRLDESGAPSGTALARPILPRRFLFGLIYNM